MERMTKIDEADETKENRICKYKNCDGQCTMCHHMYQMIQKLASYEEAEEQGLLIKLPCKVGDTVFDISFGEIEEYEIEGMKFVSDDKLAYEVDTGIIMADEFGKKVFTSKEAAEEALKGGERK